MVSFFHDYRIDLDRVVLTGKVNNEVIEKAHNIDEIPLQKFSPYLSGKFLYDYSLFSDIFSAVKGLTIQHYIILNRIVRAMELIYDEENLAEIPQKLHSRQSGSLLFRF